MPHRPTGTQGTRGEHFCKLVSVLMNWQAEWAQVRWEQEPHLLLLLETGSHGLALAFLVLTQCTDRASFKLTQSCLPPPPEC